MCTDGKPCPGAALDLKKVSHKTILNLTMGGGFARMDDRFDNSETFKLLVEMVLTRVITGFEDAGLVPLEGGVGRDEFVQKLGNAIATGFTMGAASIDDLEASGELPPAAPAHEAQVNLAEMISKLVSNGENIGISVMMLKSGDELKSGTSSN